MFGESWIRFYKLFLNALRQKGGDDERSIMQTKTSFYGSRRGFSRRRTSAATDLVFVLLFVYFNFEFRASEFLATSLVVLTKFFGDSLSRFCKWSLERGINMAHVCAICERRATKFCDWKSKPKQRGTHKWRICRKCCGCK